MENKLKEMERFVEMLKKESEELHMMINRQSIVIKEFEKLQDCLNVTEEIPKIQCNVNKLIYKLDEAIHFKDKLKVMNSI